MPLLPLLLLLMLLALLVLAWPWALWQRYRRGRARRRGVRWQATLNVALVAAACAVFVAVSALSGVWIDGALLHALCGLVAGVPAGAIGLALTRFERDDAQGWYTPSAAWTLLLTALIAARVVAGLVRAWQFAQGGAPPDAGWWLQPVSAFALGGLLLGHALVYGAGLRRWLARVG